MQGQWTIICPTYTWGFQEFQHESWGSRSTKSWDRHSENGVHDQQQPMTMIKNNAVSSQQQEKQPHKDNYEYAGDLCCSWNRSISMATLFGGWRILVESKTFQGDPFLGPSGGGCCGAAAWNFAQGWGVGRGVESGWVEHPLENS